MAKTGFLMSGLIYKSQVIVNSIHFISIQFYSLDIDTEHVRFRMLKRISLESFLNKEIQ